MARELKEGVIDGTKREVGRFFRTSSFGFTNRFVIQGGVK